MIALLFLEVRIYHLPIMHYLFDDIYANILNSLVNFSILKENIFLHDNQHMDYKVLDDQYKGCLSIGLFFNLSSTLMNFLFSLDFI